ncbi:MAG: ABC transporter permease [Magnetococcales bacterium]|nr:ABC transporter permease [Magnetococcales bacterium]
MFSFLFAEAWRSLGANRLRTLLTMLGIVIGVGAVILMLAVGQGAQQAVNQTISSMGSNLFIIRSGAPSSSGVRGEGGSMPTLTVEDAEALATLPSLDVVAPVHFGSAQVVHGSLNWNTSVYGVTPSFLAVRSWSLASGYPFGDSDVRSATRVAILGRTVVENLFGEADPLGQTVRIKQQPFRVVAVLGQKGQSLDGRDQDDTILIPLSTAQRKLFGTPFPGTVRMIMARAISEPAMDEAEKAMKNLLRQRHRLREHQEEDFTLRNLTAIASSAAETTRIMSMLLGAIASISLVVGGIGIMNIMLVSVTERTREIGLRLAVGARQKDILGQFLLEAMLLSILGCSLGVALGMGCAQLLENAIEFEVVVTGMSVLIAFSVAGGVGILFGFYPALAAARKDPVEALRHQ